VDPFDIYTTARYINSFGTGGTSFSSSINVSSISTPSLFGITANGTSWNEWLNGGTQTFTQATSNDFKNVNAGTGFIIGGRYDQVTNLTGYVAETIVYLGILSTTDRQKVEGYLAWKWGIQTSLPSSHPYYSSAPYTTTTTAPTNTGYIYQF
jgi:hypothetical protein